MAVGIFFFSAASTAQNSPELHFRFINSFIQSSLLRSLEWSGLKVSISNSLSVFPIKCFASAAYSLLKWGRFIYEDALLFIYSTLLHDPQFFQNCGHLQYNISWNHNKVSWCIIENDHNFERTEDRATVIWKWTDFTYIHALGTSFALHLEDIVDKKRIQKYILSLTVQSNLEIRIKKYLHGVSVLPNSFTTFIESKKKLSSPFWGR